MFFSMQVIRDPAVNVLYTERWVLTEHEPQTESQKRACFCSGRLGMRISEAKRVDNVR